MRLFLIRVMAGLAALLSASAAFGQCGTTLPGGTLCGNPTASQGLNQPINNPVLGIPGSKVGSIGFANLTSGTVTLQPVTGALGTRTILMPAASGTMAVNASTPLVLNATTGNLTCPTCQTGLTPPANPSGSVQFNNGGVFGGNAGLTYSAGNALVISPTALTNNSALNITQSTPNGGSVAGPIHGNVITFTDGTQTVTGSGIDAFGQIPNRTDAFQVNVNVTGGTANHFGMNSMMNVTATNGGTVAVGGGIYINSGSTITGNVWGGDYFIKVGSGSTLNQTAMGIASEVGGSNTGTMRDRIGVGVSTFGTPSITGTDAALAIYLDTINAAPYNGAAPFSIGIYFSNNLLSAGTFPIATTGDIIKADIGTVTNFLDAPTLTISGNFVSLPHVTWGGAGNLQINKSSAAVSSSAAVLSTTVADFVNVDGSPARLAVRGFGSGGVSPGYLGYGAGGTAATPTATLNNDLLVVLGGIGYSGSAYNPGGGGGLLVSAIENFGTNNGGTNVQIYATPLGSTTQGVAATFWFQGTSGSLAVGATTLTNPGAGIIRVSTGYQIGNSAPTAGHVLRSNGTSFIDGQLACADLAVACITGNQMITLSGDTTGSGTTAITTTTAKVNGVAYGTSPSTNTVPVVTSANTVTYEAVPNAALANSTISGVALGSNLFTLTFGTHLTSGGSSYNGSAAVTITSDCTNANTASTMVCRDASGNFSAGTITASLTGHASLDLALTGGTMSGAIAMGTNAITGLTTLASAGALTLQSNGSIFACQITTGQQVQCGPNQVTPLTGPILTITRNTATPPATGLGTTNQNMLNIVGIDGANADIVLQAFGSGFNGGIRYLAARNTAASPAAMQSGDTLGVNFGYGYDGTAYVPSAGFIFTATDTFQHTGPQKTGGRVDIYGTTTGTTGIAAACSFAAGFGCGTTNDPLAGSGIFTGHFQIGSGTLATLSAGEFDLAKISASGTAPSAGNLKIAAVAGTNAGTCKLIAYAGTSTTPVTIVDNIGLGC
jgi:hypothetical protein